MNETMQFTVPGKPQGKGRPRATTLGGFTRMYTPPKTAAYETLIRDCWLRTHGTEKLEGAVFLRVDAFFTVPKSCTKARRELCLSGRLQPCCKPDADNIAKVVADALNGVAYADDASVVQLCVVKHYGEEAQLVVTLRSAEVSV